MIAEIKLDYFRQGDHFRAIVERSRSISDAFKEHAQQLSNDAALSGAAKTMTKVSDILNGCHNVNLLHVEPNAVYINCPEDIINRLISEGVANQVQKGVLYFITDDGDSD